MTLSDEDVEKYVGILDVLVDKMPDPRKGQVRALLDGPVGESFMISPASSREDYHSCYAGGLLVHSLNVVQNLKRLADTLAPGRWSNPTLSFVGLFHDLGKAGDLTGPLYVPNPNEYGKRRGFLYETNRSIPYMTVSERTLFVLQEAGIRLTSEEFLALKLSDGQYIDENRSYAMKEPDLAVLVHMADLWSTKQEKLPPG